MPKALWNDRIVRLFVALQVLVLLPYFSLRSGSVDLTTYADLYVQLPLVTALCIALFAFAAGRKEQGDRRFWNLLGLGQTCWLLAELLGGVVPDSWLVTTASDQVQDTLLILGYLSSAFAIASRPEIHRGKGPGRRLRTLRSVGTGVLFFGLLIYFTAIPREEGDFWRKPLFELFLPSMILCVTADLYILMRLGQAFRMCQSRDWRVIYGVLLTAFGVWLVLDVLETLFYAEIVPWVDPGTLLVDLPWFLPSFLVLAAVRLRASQGPTEVRENHAEKEPPRHSLPWGGPLFLYAAVLPTVHYIVSLREMLDPATLRQRELCVLVVVGVLSALALIYQRTLESEHRKLAASLHSVDEQLQLAQRMEAVGRLAGGMAHDFNNMLQVIQACTELQTEKLSAEDPARKWLAQISAATQRAASLTAQLLTVVKRAKSAPHSLDLNEVVSELGMMLQRVLGDDIRLRCELDPDLASVSTDRGEIEQVILNIAINARDAMKQGGVLQITTSAMGPQETELNPLMPSGPLTVLTMRDSGHGMDEETRVHIFEPFFTTKSEADGTGLGLSVVYGIVQRAGGHIAVESELGAGSTFRVFLPVALSAGAKAPDLQIKHALPATAGSETVLVVEDEHFVREVTTQLLKGLGYRTLAAASGEEALAILAANRGAVDLVLTDVVMAGMNGPQLAQRIQRSFPEVRIRFMSGYSGDALSGAQGFSATSLLRKPFKRAELSLLIRAALDQPLPAHVLRNPEREQVGDYTLPTDPKPAAEPDSNAPRPSSHGVAPSLHRPGE